jgi:hypothetical protein
VPAYTVNEDAVSRDATTLAGGPTSSISTLLGAADVELQGARLAPAEKAVCENATTAVRAALGATGLEQSTEEGRVLGRDAAGGARARLRRPFERRHPTDDSHPIERLTALA